MLVDRATNFDLPEDNTDSGATIDWATSDANVVTDEGEVTLASGSNATATLTATVTVGTEVVTRDFVIELVDQDDLVVGTVAETLAKDDGEVVLVTGIVSGFNYKGEPFIQDADGTAMFLDDAEDMDEDVAIGDLIVVMGTLNTNDSFNNDQREIENSLWMSTTSSGNAVAVRTDVDAATLGVLATIGTYSSQRMTMDLTVASVSSSGYSTFVGDGTTFIKYYTGGHPYFSEIYEVGDVITMTFNVYTINYDDVSIEQVELPALTDAENLVVAQAMLDIPETATEDLTLPTAFADYNATVVWASDNEAVISTAGVVVVPAEGAADVTVTLTATVTVGSETPVDVVFTVLVPAPVAPYYPVPGIFFSEYIEGSSNNKAIEIYNSTGAAMDLTGYMINYYNNGAATPTKSYDLTGITLGSGEVYVICTDTYANQADCDESQAYADPDAVVFFNGDDALEIVMGATVIDVIGLVGEDPGSQWPVGDDGTQEHTIRRNADVVGGNPVFTEDEWSTFAQDTFDGLGAHTGPIVVPDIFFSEYIEGSSNNKALEIYNPTGAAVDLTGYVINYYNNGAATPTKTYDLTGITLGSGEVYVICTDSYANQADCDESQAYGDADSVVFFNGDDAIELMKNSVAIDVIGLVGTDPGSNWAVGDGATNEHTLVRSPGVYMGATVFAPGEWMVYDQDTFDMLGTHESELPE
jgi:hypothetical protein